jgi:FlaG/FlaF family flagellin (archaellin)
MTATDRGVSEFTGVAILVAATVLVTASVGLFVLVGTSEEAGPPQANFSYQYIEGSSTLIVNHEFGDTFDARNLTLESSDNTARWHELAGTNQTAPVGPGATIQLSSNNAWGENVADGERIRIFYAPPSGNRTMLSRWPPN